MSIWSFTYGLEIYFPGLSQKLLIVSLEYVGIVGIPVFMMFFALEFTGQSRLLTIRTRLLLWLIPIITLVLVWTNSYHHWMWDQETLVSSQGLTLLSVRFGVFFWIHAAYSYSLLLIASLLLAMEVVQRPGIYRGQASFVIVGILLPLVGNLLFITKTSLMYGLDLTPLAFLPAAFGFGWAIVRYRLLEILPLEHLNVLRNMRDGVIVLSPNRRMLYLNPTAEELFNRTEDEAIGQPISLISETFAERLNPFLNGTDHRAEIPIETDGKPTIFEVTVSPIAARDNRNNIDQPDTIVTLHDITHRKEAEAALSRRESIMSAISMAAEQFLRETSWEQNVPRVLEGIGKAADVSRVLVAMNYLDDQQGVHVSLCYEWAANGIESQLKNPMLQHINLRRQGFARWENALSQGLPIQGFVQDLPDEEQRFLAMMGSLSIAVIPIFVELGWWGFLMFEECSRERQWTGMELDAFYTAADIFGAAEGRARTEHRARQKQNSLNLLNDIVREALTAQTLQEMAQKAVDRLGDLIHADGCFLTRWDETQKRTLTLAAYGPYRETYTKIQASPGKKTLTESVLTIGRTLIIEDAYNSPYLDPDIAQKFPSRAQIVIPLIAGGKKLGALIFAHDHLHTFQQEEIIMSEQAAGLIALAYEKFDAMEEATRRADTSEILRKASMAVTEKLELEQAVMHILEQLNQVIPYDSASVQLLEGNELEIIGGHGWEDLNDVIGMRFPVPSDNPNTRVIETKQPFYLPDAWDFSENFRKPPHNHIRSWLGVPLIAQGRIIGLLAIDSSEPNDFDEADIRVASEFANQVAIVLENARLFSISQTQAIIDALTNVYNRRGLYQLGEFEFERARRIQRPFSILMFDIDHFKQVNDTHGHVVGDQVLRHLAARCRQNSRAMDIIGRYGGEEFVILLPETNLESARQTATRLRRTIIRTPFITAMGSLPITVSMGVAEATERDTFNALVEKADKALYRAKQTGRDRIVSHQEDSERDQT
jgi:diguanylate cyclase (GGDEF)-like protein/PAS domain S-box-containing protein